MRHVLHDAADDVDGLVSAALLDGRKPEPLVAALGAAAASVEQRRIQAPGRAVRAGVLADDQAMVDQERLVVEALAVLEPPDVRLPLMLAGGNGDRTSAPGWTRTCMVCVDTRLAPVVDALIARLSGVGLIGDTANGSSSEATWRITEFGQVCLDRLRQAGGSSDR